jgi:hypothetical protein
MYGRCLKHYCRRVILHNESKERGIMKEEAILRYFDSMEEFEDSLKKYDENE